MSINVIRTLDHAFGSKQWIAPVDSLALEEKHACIKARVGTLISCKTSVLPFLILSYFKLLLHTHTHFFSLFYHTLAYILWLPIQFFIVFLSMQMSRSVSFY